MMKFLVRFRAVLLSLTLLLAGFGIAGALWLPGYVKSQAEASLSKTLGREVTIGKIEISPYLLRVDLHELKIATGNTKVGKDASPTQDHLLTIKTIRANLSVLSLAQRAPVLQELTIDSPDIRLARDAKNRLSVADILETLAKAPKSEEPVRFAIHNIQLKNGNIELIDGVKNKTHKISDLTIGLPVVNNFPASEEIWIEPHISAKVNGAAFNLQGKTHIFGQKKEAIIDFDLQDLPLAGLETYADMVPGLKITNGSVSTKISLSFIQEPNQAAITEIKGDLRVKNLSGLHKSDATHLHTAINDLNIDVRGIGISLPDITAKSRVAGLELKSGTAGHLTLTDPALKDVKPFVVKNISAKLNDIDLAGKSPMALEISALINQQGKISAKGSLTSWTDPTNAAGTLDIQANRVDVIAFQRYAGDVFNNALFTRGQANFNGQVKIGAHTATSNQPSIESRNKPIAQKTANQALAITVTGDAALSDFSLLDQNSSAEIARWKQVQAQGLTLTTQPFAVKIRLIDADALFGRVTILPTGELNFRRILEPQSATGASAAPATPSKPQAKGAEQKQVVTPPTKQSIKADLPVEIGQIRLKDCSILFNDQFTKPNFRAGLTNLSGTLGPLKAGAPGGIDITGTVDRSAPLLIQGKLDPFGRDLFLDLKVIARGIEMPPISPYSVKYLAYPIEKGKLSLDLNYLLQGGQLKAENQIFLDQLTLGNKVESPDAISAPVSLAVALLKNSRGEIDINLPISGSINDPEFQIGSIVFKALINLIVKAATAPFSLIASLFGGGADLTQIEFSAGAAAINPQAAQTIDSIAKAMIDRPALKLEITSSAASAMDTDGAKRAILNRQVRAEKLANITKKGESAGALRDVEVTAQEYPKYLTQVYKKAPFKKERNLMLTTKTLPVPEMESLLLQHIQVGDTELLALADQRSRAVRNQLIKQGVSAERVFVMGSKLGDAGQAEFSLR